MKRMKTMIMAAMFAAALTPFTVTSTAYATETTEQTETTYVLWIDANGSKGEYQTTNGDQTIWDYLEYQNKTNTDAREIKLENDAGKEIPTDTPVKELDGQTVHIRYIRDNWDIDAEYDGIKYDVVIDDYGQIEDPNIEPFDNSGYLLSNNEIKWLGGEERSEYNGVTLRNLIEFEPPTEDIQYGIMNYHIKQATIRKLIGDRKGIDYISIDVLYNGNSTHTTQKTTEGINHLDDLNYYYDPAKGESIDWIRIQFAVGGSYQIVSLNEHNGGDDDVTFHYVNETSVNTPPGHLINEKNQSYSTQAAFHIDMETPDPIEGYEFKGYQVNIKQTEAKGWMQHYTLDEWMDTQASEEWTDAYLNADGTYCIAFQGKNKPATEIMPLSSNPHMGYGAIIRAVWEKKDEPNKPNEEKPEAPENTNAPKTPEKETEAPKKNAEEEAPKKTTTQQIKTEEAPKTQEKNADEETKDKPTETQDIMQTGVDATGLTTLYGAVTALACVAATLIRRINK